MIHPRLLADFFVLAMIAGTVYFSGCLLLSVRRGTSPEIGLDAVLVRIAMCVAMTGMLIPRYEIGAEGMWISIFAVGAGWFGLQAVREMIAARRLVPHLMGPSAHHLAACGAMLYMYLAMRMTMDMGALGTMEMRISDMRSMGSMSSMSMGMTTRFPWIAVGLASLFIASAVWHAARVGLARRRVAIARPTMVSSGVHIGTFAMMGYMMIVMA